MSARFIVGDSLTVLRTMPGASVDLVLTSPPFLALRSYLPADHPDKALEMGSEPTPGAFIDALLDIVEECRRVLAPHGSLCFELGDTYAGSGGSGGDYNENGLREGQPKVRSQRTARRVAEARHMGTTRAAGEPMAKIPWRTNDRDEDERNAGLIANGGRTSRPDDVANGLTQPRRRPGPEGRDGVPGWPLDKSLCLIPEIFRFALVYGFNPLTGRETPRWRARNVVRWCRPNPPVGALADKVRPATSDMVIACMSRKRYFDLDAIRTPLTEPGAVKRHSTEQRNPSAGWATNSAEIRQNENGAPPLDHWWHDEDAFDQDAWLISTEPYKGSHYATWPEALVEKPIQAMCPRRVCTTCGKPSERITESQRVRLHDGAINPERVPPTRRHGMGVINTTLGWTDCDHDAWRDGVVLDPFAGSGTTLAVAFGHGRSSIGIDLDHRNAELARQRVGMWLEVDAKASDLLFDT